jgi:hypothetical protein
MKLIREELIKAAEFIKPAILISDQPDPKNYVHVQIQGERCQFTAADGHCGKRVTLFRPAQLSFEEKEVVDPDQEFFIGRATFLGFTELCKKHKAKFEKAARRDQTLKYIDIGPAALESSSDCNTYEQPACKYPNIDAFFTEGNEEMSTMKIDPKIAIAALKEFPGNVEISFHGINEQIYMQTSDGIYQAGFAPIEQRGDDEKS